MVSKRQEANQKREAREAERRQRFEADSKLREEQRHDAFISRFKGMDEQKILALLTLEAELSHGRCFFEPKTEFERVRKLFEELGVEFNERNLRLVSEQYSKLYCRKKGFKKLLAGDWSELRNWLLTKDYPRRAPVENIGILLRDEKRLLAERFIANGNLLSARELYIELGDEEGLKRLADKINADECAHIEESIRREHFESVSERIEKLPEELRPDLRLLFAKSAISRLLRGGGFSHDIVWYQLVEYVHRHKLEAMMSEAEELIRKHIGSDPNRVAYMAFDCRYFQPTEDEVLLLYSSVRDMVRSEGKLDQAVALLRGIHPEETEAYRREYAALLLNYRLFLLAAQRFEEAEGPEFSDLAPVRIKDFLSLLQPRHAPFQRLDMKSETVAYIAKLVVREQAIEAQPT